MNNDNHTSTHTLTRSLHWLMALLLLSLLVIGFYMTIAEDYSVYDIHKAFGVIALGLIILRLIWRVKNPWQSSSQDTDHEKLVHFAHLSLLALALLMPISGMFNSGFGGYGIHVFGWEMIDSRYNAEGTRIAINQTLSDAGRLVHEVLGYLFSAIILLHIAAALKHHFIDKDKTLTRMLGRQS